MILPGWRYRRAQGLRVYPIGFSWAGVWISGVTRQRQESTTDAHWCSTHHGADNSISRSAPYGRRWMVVREAQGSVIPAHD